MNYYNEHDPKAAAWLRVLIEEGQIPKGIVDERDIQNVRADEIAEYRQCHFFSGIGGWSLALRLAGVPDEWPVWTGSCPCQPFSCTGRGMAEADERHLWPDFRNLIGQCRPAIIFGEQVAGKGGLGWLAGVSADLEAGGYRFAAADLCAAGVGSPQKRQRLYWVAAAPNACTSDKGLRRVGKLGLYKEGGCDLRASGNSERKKMSDAVVFTTGEQDKSATTRRLHAEPCSGGATGVALGDTDMQGSQRFVIRGDGSSKRSAWTPSMVIQTTDGKNRRIPIEPAFFPLAHGLPGRVAVLKGFGNSIVPQLAAAFIQAAIEAETGKGSSVACPKITN